MRRGRNPIWPNHVELFEMWSEANDDPDLVRALCGLAEGEELQLEEGTGAPEGRADFPFFLQTVIRHAMRERFKRVAMRWRTYAGVESLRDFRMVTTSQLNGIVGMGPIPEGQTGPRMRSSELPGPPMMLAKHGGYYGVTMEMVINDETDRILNRVPGELGERAGSYQNRALVSYIEANPTYTPDGQPFFGAAHGNEYTGSAADPTEDNLVTMLEAMSVRREPDTGDPYEIEPRKIVVRGQRQQLRLQQAIRSGQTIERSAAAVGTTTFSRGQDNPLAYEGGILPSDAVVREPWLNDPNDWYILGDADNRPAFIMSFLRGKQEPFVGIKDSQARDAMGAGTDPYEWDFDTIDFKVRSIFGVSAGEPFAIVRNRP